MRLCFHLFWCAHFSLPPHISQCDTSLATHIFSLANCQHLCGCTNMPLKPKLISNQIGIHTANVGMMCIIIGTLTDCLHSICREVKNRTNSFIATSFRLLFKWQTIRSSISFFHAHTFIRSRCSCVYCYLHFNL